MTLQRRLWLTLAALTAVGHIAMVSVTQEKTLALMTLLIWGGALLCLEDQFPALVPAPSAFGLGALVLAFGLQRTSAVLHLDFAASVLPLWLGLGLALLCLPLRQLRRWGPSLLVLALLPLSLLLNGGGVSVAGPCSGIELIAQLLVIAVVFVLAFPLPVRRSRWLLWPLRHCWACSATRFASPCWL